MNISSVPSKILQLTPEKIFNGEDELFYLLDFIKSLFLTYQPIKKSRNPDSPFLFKKPTIPREETAKFPTGQLKAEIGMVKSPSFPEPEKQAKTGIAINNVKEAHTPNESKQTNSFPINTSSRSESEMKKALSRGILIKDSQSPYTFPISSNTITQLSTHKTDLSPSSVKTINAKKQLSVSTEHSARKAIKKTTSTERLQQRSSEVQYSTSNIRSPQVQIEKVPIKVKLKILQWLQDIQLIKEDAVTIAEFPSYCRNGVLFADLIQRLEGVIYY